MRVTGGVLKGRRLSALRGLSIRPSTDYLRESIFNILAGFFDDAVILDLFAGTGSLGIEALSRGASTAVFVDNAPQAVKTLKQNMQALALEDRSTILKRDILRGLSFLKSQDTTFDLVFIDPPYDRAMIEKTLRFLGRADLTGTDSVVVAEHSSREIPPDRVSTLVLNDRRRHGKTLVSFYRPVV